MHTLFRSLRRSPAFVLTVVATLALGVGLNTALFTVVDSVLLRPLGFHGADRLVAIQTRFVEEHRSIPRVAGADYADLARGTPGLESAAFYSAYEAGLSLHGSSLYLPIAMVSPQFLEALGVQPLVGRLFRAQDTVGTEALVSGSFARQHFASPAAALSHPLLFEGKLYTIVGVLPDGFTFPRRSSIWLEHDAAAGNSNRTSYNDQVIGRMRPGISLGQLNAQLDTLSRQLQRTYPEDRHKALVAIPLQDQLVRDIRPTLRLLMGSVALLLLVVAANLTHLQLVRSTRQLRSTTIRTALGASRSTIAGMALLEATVLAFVGGAAALLVAFAALRALIRLAPPDLPRLADLRVNPEVFLFSFGTSFAVMLVTAALPVWRSWHLSPAAVLRADSARGSASRTSVRLRDGLLIAEIALTLTLSVLALLVTRQLLAQSREDLGFSPDHLVILDTHTVTPPVAVAASAPTTFAAQYAAALAQATVAVNHLQSTLDSLAATPGVLSAAAVRGAPMGYSSSQISFAIEGRQSFTPPYDNLPGADLRVITPNYPATLGVPLLAGRQLSAADRLDTPRVTLVNRSFAEHFFPGQTAIGQRIFCGYDSETPVAWTIVGVIADIHDDSPAAPPTPNFYIPLAQHPFGANDLQVVVRTSLPAPAAAETLRRVITHAHPETAVRVATMREAVSTSQQADRFRSILFSSFAAVSLLLAAVGIYGVTAYTVVERRFEFGLRFALGATRPAVLSLVLRRTLAVAAAGSLLGLLLSFALHKLLAHLLDHPPALDVFAPLAASALLIALSLAATLLPARRAALTNPMEILRAE